VLLILASVPHWCWELMSHEHVLGVMCVDDRRELEIDECCCVSEMLSYRRADVHVLCTGEKDCNNSPSKSNQFKTKKRYPDQVIGQATRFTTGS
jgi:hypothetical protein